MFYVSDSSDKGSSVRRSCFTPLNSVFLSSGSGPPHSESTPFSGRIVIVRWFLISYSMNISSHESHSTFLFNSAYRLMELKNSIIGGTSVGGGGRYCPAVPIRLLLYRHRYPSHGYLSISAVTVS